MTNGGRRERAEAAFGHLQQAASEMIAAAHDTLDLLDDVVSTAELREVFATVDLLRRTMGNSRRSTDQAPNQSNHTAAEDGRPRPSGADRDARRASPVQRISVL
jgi:hypothetical protein